MQAKAFVSRRRWAAFAVIGACFIFSGCAAHTRASAHADVSPPDPVPAVVPTVGSAVVPDIVPVAEQATNAPQVVPVVFQTGNATYYARRFDGHRTASGERYDMRALSAAHRTLPLGSYVRVTDVRNKRSVVVRINDRGPFVKDRVIDLSFAAATLLGLQRAGSGRVTLERVTADQADARRVDVPLTHTSVRRVRRTRTHKKHRA